MIFMVGGAEIEIQGVVIVRIVMRIIGKVAARIISAAENDMGIL